MTKNLSLFLTILFSIFYILAHPALIKAQTVAQADVIEQILNPDSIATESADIAATSSAEATPSGKLASASAEAEQKIQEKKADDITETIGKQKSKLVIYLDEHPIGPLSWHNFFQHALRKAIEMGLPANIIVLLILFPLIASVISVSRHIIGLKGFGIYIPAVLSVAFVSTGIINGIIIFITVLAAALLTRRLVKKLKLAYLPRTAMVLWGVSILILVLLMGSAYLNLSELTSINIFPLLIIMLLTENFISTQLFSSQKEAFGITLETLLIAVLCSVIIDSEVIQQIIILRPEITLIITAIINYVTAKYTGLRLLEFIRFNPIFQSLPFTNKNITNDDDDKAE